MAQAQSNLSRSIYYARNQFDAPVRFGSHQTSINRVGSELNPTSFQHQTSINRVGSTSSTSLPREGREHIPSCRGALRCRPDGSSISGDVCSPLPVLPSTPPLRNASDQWRSPLTPPSSSLFALTCFPQLSATGRQV